MLCPGAYRAQPVCRGLLGMPDGFCGATFTAAAGMVVLRLAVPVAEVCGYVGVVEDVADVSVGALVVGGQEGEHVVTVVAAQQPDEGRGMGGGDEVDPFVGG